ncbi:oligoendopeptidase F family protein [Lacticaseibacillus hulanensis]|nr:oligoendopeptidase F family protein [Lacticaseibacillus hulanensis]
MRKGGAADAVTILQAAGLDVTKPDYLTSVFDQFAAQLEQLENMLD